MKPKGFFAVILSVFLLSNTVFAQKAEATLSLNEAFFDAFLDAVYQNFDALQFSIADAFIEGYRPVSAFGFVAARGPRSDAACDESIRILREQGGVRTAVRFREGKVYVPLGFSGHYNPPLVGCVGFAGWAESNIDLEFDRAGQRLLGRVRVTNVNLNGTGGVGGSLIARMLQGTIDKKLNPIEIVRLDKLSFSVPVQNSGTLRMQAVNLRHSIAISAVNISIGYDFLK